MSPGTAKANEPLDADTLAKVLDAVAKAAEAGRDQPGGSLYVHRPVLNGADLHTWAKGAGLANLVPPDDMHVTQVYSRTSVKLAPKGGTITVGGDGRRIAPLGDKGAVVMHLTSPELHARFDEATAAGASWDYEGGYKPHVTLSYDAGDADLAALQPPSFPLELGPEVHKPINENWATDKGFRKFELHVPISKTDEDQCLVFGWASVIEEGGKPVTDSQGDQISEAELEKAFYGFAEEARQAGVDHQDWGDHIGKMVECIVFTKEKQKALGIDLGKVGAWVGFRLKPEIFAKVKNEGYRAFSIGGHGRRVPLAA